MRINTGRYIGRVWLVAVTIFAASVAAVRAMGRSSGTQMVALVTGYVGLASIGGALFFTWRWVNHHPPRSAIGGAAIQLVLGIVLVAWLFSLVFPFL